MREKKKVTLQSLAQQLNIHVSTVSRVLRGDAETAAKAASPETIERIRTLAAHHDYKPNPHAISLRTRVSHLIGVSVPRLSDYVWATIYEGIEEHAFTEGYFAYVNAAYDRPELRRRQVSLAQARLVDGMILGDIHITRESEEFLAGLSLPFVLALRKCGSHPSVTCDDRLGGRQAAEHLFQRGHRAVSVLAGSSLTSTGVERTAGFVDFYREAGWPIPQERIHFSHFDTQSGREGCQHLLAVCPTLTAMFSVNDFAAIGAMGALRAAGHTPGVSMALVGYNDTPLAAELPIPLTSVRTPLRELGEEAMCLLLRRLRGDACTSVTLAPQLVVRESCGFSAHSLL